MDVATLGGGCFWCLEAAFEQLAGVDSAVSGYSGGALANPGYSRVCQGDTGHAEVVRVTFDPQIISYRDLLDAFFAIHNPTTLNRQDNDIGTQYRSVIFYHSSEQHETAKGLIAELNCAKIWPSSIITEVAPAQPFFPAEDYHQRYFRNNPAQGYCAFVVAPKMAKFRKRFAERLKPGFR